MEGMTHCNVMVNEVSRRYTGMYPTFSILLPSIDCNCQYSNMQVHLSRETVDKMWETMFFLSHCLFMMLHAST